MHNRNKITCAPIRTKENSHTKYLAIFQGFPCLQLSISSSQQHFQDSRAFPVASVHLLKSIRESQRRSQVFTNYSYANWIIQFGISHAPPEPEIMVQNCPDKVSEQILECSDILKDGQTLLQCMQFFCSQMPNACNESQ